MIKEHHISTVQYIVAFLSRLAENHTTIKTQTQNNDLSSLQSSLGRNAREKAAKEMLEENENRVTNRRNKNIPDSSYWHKDEGIQMAYSVMWIPALRCLEDVAVWTSVKFTPSVFWTWKTSFKPAMLNQWHSECSARLAFDKCVDHGTPLQRLSPRALRFKVLLNFLVSKRW